MAASACAPDSGADGPGRAARTFYEALARQEVPAARELALDDAGLVALEAEFGSLEAWAGRVTKNGIVARVEAVDEEVDGARASVALLVLFNDGTRRHDRIELVGGDGAWLVDMGTVPGAPGSRLESDAAAGSPP